eukprot:3426847-Amphidinium_carterae.1
MPRWNTRRCKIAEQALPLPHQKHELVPWCPLQQWGYSTADAARADSSQDSYPSMSAIATVWSGATIYKCSKLEERTNHCQLQRSRFPRQLALLLTC